MMQTSSTLFSFGALLKTFRKRQHLTQQQLAEVVGVHRGTLIHWEQGNFLPESKTVVLELARHLHLDDQEARHFLEASLTALTPHWLVPLPRNLFFTGREEILEALHAQLRSERTVALMQSSALHGLGGVGKTQIALEYAYRHALEYSAVFWIGAETAESITSSLLRVASVLQLPGRVDHDQQRVVAAVQHWLSTHGQWLLIWDNVEDLALLDHFLPVSRSGAILLTTRCQTLGTLARGIDLAPMGQEEGMLFLLRRAKVLSPEATSEQMHLLAAHVPTQYQAVAELVTELGGLPLALDQAGAYVEETHCGLPAYLDCFRTHQATLLRQRGESARDHPASAAATFTLAVTAIAERHPVVKDLLQVCALLQPDAIPEEIFRLGGEHLGPTLEAICCDALEWDRVVGLACSYSLLARQPEEQTLSMHRLVQAVLLDGTGEGEQKQWQRRVIEALNAVFPDVQAMPEPGARKRCELLLPHVLLCLQQVEAASEDLACAFLAFKGARYLYERGRYAEAEPLFRRALQIREQALGLHHPEVAQVLHKLAILSWQRGNYAQAEPLFRRALCIQEQAPRPDHPEVASLLHNLALLFWSQGNYAQAEPLYQQALCLWEQTLGPDCPELARPLNNLANLYADQGRYAEAEQLFQRVLRIQEQIRPGHPDVAFPLCNLAEVYQEQGRYVEAEPLLQRALRIREQTLGPDHPEVAHPLESLAMLYREQGIYEQAEALFQRALHIREQTLGPDHSLVARPLTGLASLSCDRGHYAQAEALFQRALLIREQQLGPHHPVTARTLHDLALLRQKQGNLKEATSFAERALHIRLRSLGHAHPKTIATQTLYTQLVREQEAEREPTLEHLRTLLKARGWSVHLKKRHGKPYVYATRKAGQHTRSRYLAPLSNPVACLAAASTLPNAKEV